MRKHLIADTQHELLFGLTFFLRIVHYMHFCSCFDTDSKLCIFILHFIHCQFCTFSVHTLHFMNNPNAIRMASVKYKSGAILRKNIVNTNPNHSHDS